MKLLLPPPLCPLMLFLTEKLEPLTVEELMVSMKVRKKKNVEIVEVEKCLVKS